MYGTVAKMRITPANRQKARDLFEQQISRRQIPGYIASYVLHENGGDVSWLVAVFQDKATYDANADDPAQDADYQEYRALMEDDPEWHDGEIDSF
jgi:quinol monooxygenase YgiN